MPALKRIEEFELPDGSYSVSDIQNYFEYIIKKHGIITERILSRNLNA